MKSRLSACFVLIFLLASLPVYAAYEFKGTQIEGTVTNGINVGGVKGDSSSSFIDESVNYSSEVNLRASRESLGFIADAFRDWKFESEINVRQTDDSQLDRRRDLHLLYLQARVYNPTVDLTFGDFYAHFTDLTLNRSLEGVQGIFTIPKTNTKITTVFSRAVQSEEAVQHTRYVFADRIEQEVLRDRWELFGKTLVNEFTGGGNFVYNFDSGGSIKEDTGVTDLDNLVLSFDASLRLLDDLTSKIEIARSRQDDANEVSLEGDASGTAVKLVNDYSFKSRAGTTRMNFDYERIDPDFLTDSGSAAVDREAVYTRLYHRFGRPLDVDAGFRAFHDNLGDQLASTLRVKNPVLKVKIQPFDKEHKWKDLALRLNYDFQENESSDNLVRNKTHIVHGLVSRRINDLSATVGYKVLVRDDSASAASRETHSIVFRTAYDFQRESMSLSPYVDYAFRVQDDDSPNQREWMNDIRMGLSLTLFKKFRLNTNYGYGDVDRGMVLSDSVIHLFDVNVEYDITDRWMLVGIYTLTDNTFETHDFDFDENFGEVKILYRF